MHVVLSYAVYVIFGATGGIGQDLAKRLLAANNKVVLAAHDEGKLSKLKEELGGGEIKAIDVMNSKQVCLCTGTCLVFMLLQSKQQTSASRPAVALTGLSLYLHLSQRFLNGNCRSLTFWKVLQKSMAR